MMRYVTREEIVLNYLNSGNVITPILAERDLNIQDLDAVIDNLINDYDIVARPIHDTNGARIYEFRLNSPKPKINVTIKPHNVNKSNTLKTPESDYKKILKYLQSGGSVNTNMCQESFGINKKRFGKLIQNIKRYHDINITPLPGSSDSRLKQYRLNKPGPTTIYGKIVDFIKTFGPVNSHQIANHLNIDRKTVNGYMCYVKRKNKVTVVKTLGQLTMYSIG